MLCNEERIENVNWDRKIEQPPQTNPAHKTASLLIWTTCVLPSH